MDRNRDAGDCTTAQTASLSARRAWIEMLIIKIRFFFRLVALRKESVDRNHAADISYIREPSRSPQGERG